MYEGCGLRTVLYVAQRLFLHSVAPWGLCCVLASLAERGQNCRACSGIVFLSGTGSLQCVPALVMYPDSGPVWHGQSSVYVPALVGIAVSQVHYGRRVHHRINKTTNYVLMQQDRNSYGYLRVSKSL